MIDGKPDLGGLGQPEALARSWIEELKFTPEEGLKKLVEELEDALRNQKAL